MKKNLTDRSVSVSVSTEVRRERYIAPSVRPLGEWQALTLVSSLPIHIGGAVFGPEDDTLA